MAINKNAVRRYRILDKCLRNIHQRYTIDDLLDAVNEALQEDGDNACVKKRQLYADINFMESDGGYGAEIDRIKDGRHTYYRYEEPSFSINNAPISEAEAVQLRTAIQTLSRFEGLPQFEWVNELVPKLEKIIGSLPAERNIISFEANQYLKGIDLLPVLFHAILYKKVLMLQYKSFRWGEASDLEVHPYYLKQYNSRWFLFGHCYPADKLLTLALDRIEEAKETGMEYRENFETDFTEYFEDFIGVTRPDKVEAQKVVIEVGSSLAPYLLTKPIHPSQKAKKTEGGGFVLTLDLIPNYELESLLLSHGEQLKVIRPDFLRERVRQRLLDALEGYAG